MKLKIDNKLRIIPSISELTFDQYNNIFNKAKVSTLPEYLSFFLNTSIDDINNMKFKGMPLGVVVNKLFDVPDLVSVVKTKKSTLLFRDEYYAMSDIDIDTVGKHYLYELIIASKEYNVHEQGMIALSVALCKEVSDTEVVSIYKELSKQSWREVLPQAFFLAKKYQRGIVSRMLKSLSFIHRLKVVENRIRIYVKKCRNLV